MRTARCFCLVLAFALAPGLAGSAAEARDVRGEERGVPFVSPRAPENAREIGSSMFQAAAAGTTVLAWYQFDAGGAPNPQAWTQHDRTVQPKVYFHVDGPACNGISAINGTRSMWCGQWATSEDPWCGWSTLPGCGDDWDQRLEATVAATTLSYTVKWDSEAGYDFSYLEWWDPVNSEWVPDSGVNGGTGYYDGAGGPLVETRTSPYGPTNVRFRFTSDGAWSDEDGLSPTVEGAVKVDDISIDGGAVEDFEGAPCNATAAGGWVGSMPPGYGLYSELHLAGSVVQEDPCLRPLSTVWGFFDDPLVTNYACGGWPLQGAIPYGPNAYGQYMSNEVWSPWIPIAGEGDVFLLDFLVYRDFPFDELLFYTWYVRTRDNDAGGCASAWTSFNFFYHGLSRPDWKRERFSVGSLVPAGADEIQIALGALDGCPLFCGMYGSPNCHSQGPLFDQVRLLRVNQTGPQWAVSDFHLWQDNFPETGGVGPTDYARCDMATNLARTGSGRGIVPGDSLSILVSDANGLADDNTGGRPGKAVYAFVRVTDRFGNPVSGKSGLALQSPDNVGYSHPIWGTDPQAGIIRWPFVAGVAPAGWDAYRMDYTYINGQSSPVPQPDRYCVDLMDLSAGPHSGPTKHGNENHAANTGIFAPGDVIHYFLGARNTAGVWSYWHRTMNGQGRGVQTNDIAEAMGSPCEWSVLPDAGRAPGELGDILFVDDADDRGGPAQFYFDMAFRLLGIEDRVDRFDVLGPSSAVGNSLASRVKNFRTQLIGDTVEVYQKILWNCSDLTVSLMCDGGGPNGGTGIDNSNDFALCDSFLTHHSDHPGWAYWGNNVVENWWILSGAAAVSVRSKYMNHTLVDDDQSAVTGLLAPPIQSVAGSPWNPESFISAGACFALSDFDAPGATGSSFVSHRYNGLAGAPAAVYQATANTAGSVARFFLAGFGFNFIRDDAVSGVPDYATHLHETLLWMNNELSAPTGIDPVAYANRLANAYPNPFNPTTTIEYGIASAGRVSLRIYNAAGQLVRTLVDEEQAPRPEGFSVTWNGKDDRGQSAASGVYFYRLTAKGFERTKKLVLLK